MTMKICIYHDFYFDPKDLALHVERGWFVIYYGGPSACTWLVPGTVDPDL